MPNLNLNTIALVSTLNPAPFNGSPISEDYNDFQDQTLLDLTSVSTFINNVLIPMLVALPDSAISGLEGTSIYGDSTNQTALFYDQITGEPLTLTDSLNQLAAQVSTSNLNVGNLSIQVGQLQQKLSSTNQNNIAITLQNLTNSLNVLNNQQIATDAAVSEVQSVVNKTQTARLTVNIPANSTTSNPIFWTNAFTDNFYTTTLGLNDGSAQCSMQGFVYGPPGTGIAVTVTNPTSSVQNITINAIAIHD
jgi:hypothetical protein